jgi:hypothetical protein
MIKPNDRTCGTAEAPIVVKAITDGAVDIDGNDSLQPVLIMYQNSYMIFEGFNAHNSVGNSVVEVTSTSNHNIFRRICAWDATNGNSSIWGIHGAEYNLVEDCAGWGMARKVYSNSQGGNYTTFRRCWGMWELNPDNYDLSAPRMTYTLFYNSYHITMENCIGTWDSKGVDPASPAPYGVFGSDREDGDKNTYCAWLGCIAYVTEKEKLTVFNSGDDCGGMFHFVSWHESIHTNMTVKDCIAYVDPTHSNIKTFELRMGSSLAAENITSVGGAGSTISDDWDISGHLVSTGANLITNNGTIVNPSASGIDSGATIMYRYVDRVLTTTPLWPWPMNQRIIDAMTASGRKPVDVTNKIMFLGFPPNKCVVRINK